MLVRRVHERERHAGRCECHGDRPTGLADQAEEERDRGRHGQRPRGGAGELERSVRPSAARRERNQRDLSEHRGERERGGVEHRASHLEGEHERERREDARLVQDNRRRVDTAEPRHEREPPVPEREGVARMQPAVLELVHRAQRERAEVEELAHAAEMKERVAVDDALDAPQRDAEADPGERDETSPARGLRMLATPPAPREGQRGRAGSENERERQVDRSMHRERER
jgi:hypothetical protein